MKRLLNTLYITTSGRYLSLDGENVVISENSNEIGRIPLHNLDGIIAFGSNGVSPALMGKCVNNSIGLALMDRNGKFLARIEGKRNGNVLLRRKQYRIADDDNTSLGIAKNMIIGKLFNSRWVLDRMVRDHAMRIDAEQFDRKIDFLKESIARVSACEGAESLRGIEGEAATVYFSVFNDMILQQKEDFVFSGRNKHPPLDRVNALLSFAYSLATGMCVAALESVGLDAYVGFLHTDRPGRCSLALDLVEEFRAVLCDRFVLTLINKRMIDGSVFDVREDGAVWLNDEGRRIFLQAWQTKKQEELRHPFLDEKIQWGLLPYVQALLLSRYLRGDLDEYPPFLWK